MLYRKIIYRKRQSYWKTSVSGRNNDYNNDDNSKDNNNNNNFLLKVEDLISREY